MSKRKSSNGKFEFKGFHNLSFTEAEVGQIVVFQETHNAGVDGAIINLLEAGYKLGYAYDDYHGTYQGSLTCKEPGSPYFGYSFTMKNNSPSRIAYAFLWVYDTLLKEELLDLETKADKFDW